jgi:antitoxin MazE
MQTNIVKWGNSQGIRIPKAFLRNIQVAENEPVDVILEREKIIIKKINAKKHKTTRERLVEFYGTGFSKKHRPKRIIDWGKPVGKEIW